MPPLPKGTPSVPTNTPTNTAEESAQRPQIVGEILPDFAILRRYRPMIWFFEAQIAITWRCPRPTASPRRVCLQSLEGDHLDYDIAFHIAMGVAETTILPIGPSPLNRMVMVSSSFNMAPTKPIVGASRAVATERCHAPAELCRHVGSLQGKHPGLIIAEQSPDEIVMSTQIRSSYEFINQYTR